MFEDESPTMPTLRHTLILRPAIALPLSALALIAPLPLMATTPALPAPAPTPAPSATHVQGPPDGMIAPSTDRPRPLPEIAVPQPQRPATPEPEQRNTPAPAPRRSEPARQAPVAASPRADAPTGQRAAPPPSGPSIAAPTPTDAAPPIATEAPLPDAAAPAAEPITPPPAATPIADNDANSTPDWLPLAALGGLLLVLGGGWWWWRSRRTNSSALPDFSEPEPPAAAIVPPVAPAPAPARARAAAPSPLAEPVTAAAPTPVPASTAARLGRRADLHITFEPLSAQSTLINLRLGYAVTVRNTGVIAAEPLEVRIGLFAGAHAHPQGIARWFEVDDQPPHHVLPSLAPGEEYRFDGDLVAPLEALAPLTIDGRVLVVPLVAVDARYGHGAGEAPIQGQAAHAFVVGREPGAANAKLAPFRLDQGPTVFAPLGQRDTGIGKVA
jgi:hypothetical protein